MTDPSAEQLERIRQLRERRSAQGPKDVVNSTATADASPASRAGPRVERRRRPATTAKVVSAGASTTAVLIMIAGFGVAEQSAAKPVLEDQGVASPVGATAAPVPAVMVPASAAPPREIMVVVIDAITGVPISGTLPEGVGAELAEPATSRSPDAMSPGASPTPISDVPPDRPVVAQALHVTPAPVDLAVPAAPPPALAPVEEPAGKSSAS